MTGIIKNCVLRISRYDMKVLRRELNVYSFCVCRLQLKLRYLIRFYTNLILKYDPLPYNSMYITYFIRDIKCFQYFYWLTTCYGEWLIVNREPFPERFLNQHAHHSKELVRMLQHFVGLNCYSFRRNNYTAFNSTLTHKEGRVPFSTRALDKASRWDVHKLTYTTTVLWAA